MNVLGAEKFVTNQRQHLAPAFHEGRCVRGDTVDGVCDDCKMRCYYIAPLEGDPCVLLRFIVLVLCYSSEKSYGI